MCLWWIIYVQLCTELTAAVYLMPGCTIVLFSDICEQGSARVSVISRWQVTRARWVTVAETGGLADVCRLVRVVTSQQARQSMLASLIPLSLTSTCAVMQEYRYVTHLTHLSVCLLLKSMFVASLFTLFLCTDWLVFWLWHRHRKI